MFFYFPGFDHGGVYREGIRGSEEEDGHCEKGETVGACDYEEEGKRGLARAKVGREVAV